MIERQFPQPPRLWLALALIISPLLTSCDPSDEQKVTNVPSTGPAIVHSLNALLRAQPDVKGLPLSQLNASLGVPASQSGNAWRDVTNSSKLPFAQNSSEVICSMRQPFDQESGLFVRLVTIDDQKYVKELVITNYPFMDTDLSIKYY